jgi:cell wall-associated NlpC family hydrolase
MPERPATTVEADAAKAPSDAAEAQDAAEVAPESAAIRTDAGPVPPAAPSNPIVDAALELRGTPYRNGGSDRSGFDCSGFTQFVFARFDVPLPREVRDQYRAGHEVSRRKSRPGDLVFFSTVSRGASHVGIVIDEDRFVHAPSSTGVVRVESMNARYWRERFVGFRRIGPD